MAFICLAYSNHFHNGFHFDDSHTVLDNPAIRSLHNIPSFFTDTNTFSVLPANRTYRPIVSTSLALDFWLSRAFAPGEHGFDPYWYHFTTFLLFCVEVILLNSLYRLLLDSIQPSPANNWIALFAAAWYGLHPAMAETINYVIQRGDLYCTLGCLAALYVFARYPRLRPTGLYLLPFALAMLSKPPAAVFPVLLMLYSYFFEAPTAPVPGRLRRAALAALPAIAATAALLWLQSAMTPKSYLPSIISPWQYRLTQPFVWLRYAAALFLPIHLNVDSDLKPFTSLNLEACAGILFALILLVAIGISARRRGQYPIAFGLLWFVVTQLPTSLYPLSEVENDHRMFFSFPGLILAVVWGALLLLRRVLGETSRRGPFKANDARSGLRLALAGIAMLTLAGYGYGVNRRNLVWRDDESLWLDDVQKSPQNGRGLMNYGLTQMRKGAYLSALGYFTRALAYNPNYATLEINLGVVNGALAEAGDRSKAADAERHFKRAISLAPNDDTARAFYGRWLYRNQRIPEAISQLKTAIGLNPSRLMQRELLIEADSKAGDRVAARRVAQDTLELAPDDDVALHALNTLPPKDAAYWVNVALEEYRLEKYNEAITSARKALALRPSSAESYNIIGAAYAAMRQWDDAIRNDEKAIALQPDYQLAKNNLAWALSQKAAHR